MMACSDIAGKLAAEILRRREPPGEDLDILPLFQ